MTSRWVPARLAFSPTLPVIHTVKQPLPPALPLQKMTKEQLSCEKTVLQKNLLHYEGLHGRPVSRQLPELWIPSHPIRV